MGIEESLRWQARRHHTGCDGRFCQLEDHVEMQAIQRISELKTEKEVMYQNMLTVVGASKALIAEMERMRDALKEIAGRENQGNPYDPNDHPDPYSMIDEAKEALQQSSDSVGVSDERSL